MRERIVLGSRGSELALTQTRLVETALRRTWPELEVAIEIIRTSGDESSKSAPAIVDRKAGRKGMFTREIEKELLVRQIDIAVHSAKDLPSERSEELEVAATLPRANTEDVLVTKSDVSLTSLTEGAIVATGSVRRQHQLRLVRPDLEIVDLRGNVPTRLRKLHENDRWSGIILARAGLERLGWQIVGRALSPAQVDESGQAERRPYNCEILSPNDFVPAGGQAIIALQIRRDDERVRRIVEQVNDRDALVAFRAEIEFLRLLDGDCDSPVGVHAEVDDENLQLRAQIFEDETSAPKVGNTSGASADPEGVARALMHLIYG